MRPIDADYAIDLYNDISDNLKITLDKCPTVGGWVSVKDKMPENGQWVLCKCRAEIYEVLRNDFGSWYHDINHTYMSGFVTHWMPLPEPPKEEPENDTTSV